MDRKGYSAGADTDARPPPPPPPPSGRRAEERGGASGREGTPLASPLSMSSGQWLADRRHRFCHLIITKEKREGERERTMTGSVCDGEGLMDGGVISIRTGRAGKRCGRRRGLGTAPCTRTLTHNYTHAYAPENTHTHTHTHTHTPIAFSAPTSFSKNSPMYLMNGNENPENYLVL